MISPYIYPGLKLDFEFDYILEKCATVYGTTMDAILSKDRHREVTNARKLSAAIIRYKERHTLTYIADALKLCDHSMALYNIEGCLDLLETDNTYRRNAEKVLTGMGVDMERMMMVLRRFKNK